VIRVVTVAREFGSGASSISRMLADRLGWRILDHDMISEVLQAAQTDTTGHGNLLGDPWLRRLVKQVAWNAGAQRLAKGDGFSVRSEVIEEAARMRDCVIIGRGAQCILRGDPEIFHVFLYAPRALRVARSVQLVSEHADVESMIEEHDAAQAAFVREHFGLDWRDPQLYNLMIDTQHGHRAAVEAIYAAAGFRTAAAGY
jgi:cytidylate kinase